MKRFLPLIVVVGFLFGCIFGENHSSDRTIAILQLIERAKGGDPKSIYDLGRLYETGYDTIIPVDSVQSMALYLSAAEKGYAPARNFIGFKYYKGEGVKKDIDSAFYWIRLAAEAGDITAASNLGYLLLESDEIGHDEKEAARWLRVAAEAGMREAQFKYAELMKPEWETLPADSALNLGVAYYIGKSPIAAIPLLEHAADSLRPKAMALLGDAYSKGLGVPYSHHLSLEYFYNAASSGNPSAQFIIAELLDFFPDALEFVDDDSFKSAEYWYEKAAQNGVRDSETAYRLLFEHP